MSMHRRLFHTLSIIVILSMLFSGMVPSPASAQGPDGIERQVNPQTGKVSFLGPESGQVLAAADALGKSTRPRDPAMALMKRFGPEFGLQDPEGELSQVKSSRSGKGRITARYQQNYQGIPVMGGELIVNTNDNGDLYSMNGEVSEVHSLSTQPSIALEPARQIALQAAAKWYQKTPQHFIASEPELWIYDESLLRPSTRPVELVWRMEVTAEDSSMPVRELVLVNAQHGGISLHFNQIDTAWSAQSSSGAAQEPNPTVTPSPSETPLPTETPEPAVTVVPTETLPSTEQAPAAAVSADEPEADGAIWYVATTGNDTNSCSISTLPCQTMNAAIAKAAVGDTIKVAEGTYTGTGNYVVTVNNNLTLSGGWNTAFSSQTGLSVIDGQNSRAGVNNTGTGSTIDHFKITNGYPASSTSGTWAGGIQSSAPLILNHSIVSNNRSDGGQVTAGGIFSNGSLTLNNSTIRGNHSINQAAGILMFGNATLTVNNSTISENYAGRYGGGIVLYGDELGSLQVTNINNSTIVNNTALISGGGIYIQPRAGGRTVTIKNSIVAKNTSEAQGPDCAGIISNLDHSLIGNITSCTVSAGNANQLNQDPLITTLPAGAHGFYYALLPPSPAINAGANCLSTDQRGISRPQGATCDMGAYEYTVPGSASSFGIFSGSNQTAGAFFPFSEQLSVYVVDAVGSPVSGVNVTFTAPASGASGTFAGSGTRFTTVSTNDSGRAIAPAFTANSQNGTYSVSAGVSGLPGSVNFALRNATWYVSPTGVNTNSCASPAAPCLTINGAIAKASANDAIKVAVGAYTDSPPAVANITKGLTVSGGWDTSFSSQIGKSTIDGSGGTGININSTDTMLKVVITGFIIKNSSPGVYNRRGNLSFENGAITGNSRGIDNWKGILVVTNTTISGNQSNPGTGVAIRNTSGLVKIQYSTITNNSGLYGIAISGGSTVLPDIEIGNSILAVNSDDDCAEGLRSLGHNIFGSSPVCFVNGGGGPYVVADPTDRVGVDPMLFPLHPGGYHPLHPVSPAVNTADPADCPATDQRGTSRPAGTACDIGAFEHQGPGTVAAYILAYRGTAQDVPLGAMALEPLRAVVFDEGGNIVPGVNATFTAPGSGASSTFVGTNTNAATISTNANGVAISPVIKANQIQGSYSITASVAGVAQPASFQIANILQPVQTYRVSGPGPLPGTIQCTETTTNCTGGYDLHADKAHLYAIGISDFYRIKHNRGGIDLYGMPVISSVHYCDYSDIRIPCPYPNAFWNGDQMVYGDAYGLALADDVVAHEFTHGVTQYESNLFSLYQSGAINESFSDLWGEYYDQSNALGNDTAAVKWLIGEDVSGQGATRSMSNPPAYNDPDKMSSPLYYEGTEDSGGIHSNSGINNKVVYLMVNGGTFNGKTVTALGWDKTAAIYYEVNTNLLSSGADYFDLYYALQQACSNLIGQKGIVSANCTEVKDAVDAVEMNGQPAPNFNPHAPVCTTAGTVPFIRLADDLETGTSNWVFSDNNAVRWQLDSPYGPNAQSGSHSLFADDYPAEVTDATATLVSLAIPGNAYLHFAQAYEFEASGSNYYDGGVLEYKVNGSSTWVDAGSLIDHNGYKGTIYNGPYEYWWESNPMKGRSAFVGSSHGYISTRLNLASLAGKTVNFRWRMGLDAYGFAWGWWLDNIKVYTCAVPQPGTFNKTAPSNGTTGVGLNTTLSWSSSSNASSYQYCYDTIQDNQCNRTWNTVSTTSIGISSLGTNTTYYWQVRAVNASGTTDADNQSWGSFTTTATLPAGSTGIEVFIGASKLGKYSLSGGQSLRESYTGMNNGPVKIESTNAVPLIGAERLIYKVNGVATSFSEMMGLPNGQLDNTYWLPWYNNVDLDTQLRIGNVSGSTATVHIFIGPNEVTPVEGITLPAGGSTRVSYAGINAGPVQIVSDVPIVAAERLIYKVNGVATSFSEMMALPNSQLDTTYWLPWYNNVDLDTQLRFANVHDTQTAQVHVYIGGAEMPNSPFTLLPGESTRKSFAGINSGPVKIVSDVPIVAAERLIYKVGGKNTSFTETMALPNTQLDNTYWLPWYNNVDLDTQLRFANVHASQTAQVHVYIGGAEMPNSPFTLLPGESTRKSFAGINNGPVQIVSDVAIVAAERLIYKINNVNTSFSEMMALPNTQLDTLYWLPWYNNVDLDTQLRFGVP